MDGVDDGWRALGATLCMGWCKDFKTAFLLRNMARMKECHKFFASDIFQFYVNEIMKPEEIEAKLLDMTVQEVEAMWARGKV